MGTLVLLLFSEPDLNEGDYRFRAWAGARGRGRTTVS